MISGKCPYCDQKYEIDEEWIDKMVGCPSCNRNFIIPDPAKPFSTDEEKVAPLKKAAISTNKTGTTLLKNETTEKGNRIKSLVLCNVLLFLLLALAGAIAFRLWFPPSPIENNTLKNELFKHNIIKLFDVGEHITTMSSYGINKLELESEVDQFEAVLNMAIVTWPKSSTRKSCLFLNGASECTKAVEGWRLTIKLWNLKINKSDPPCEPNVNGYKTYKLYAENKLIEKVYPYNYDVAEYSRKKYLPLDDNISVLLSISAEHYQSGVTDIMKSIGAIADKSIDSI